jgi:hypothetical protein
MLGSEADEVKDDGDTALRVVEIGERNPSEHHQRAGNRP